MVGFIEGKENIDAYFAEQKSILEEALAKLKSRASSNMDLAVLRRTNNSYQLPQRTTSLPGRPKVVFGVEDYIFIVKEKAKNLLNFFVEMFSNTDFGSANPWNEIITGVGFLQVWFGYVSVLLPMPFAPLKEKMTLAAGYGEVIFEDERLLNLALAACFFDWTGSGYWTYEIKRIVEKMAKTEKMDTSAFWAFID